MMLQSVPRDQWGEVRLKSAAIEGLNGRKQQMGLKRRWKGNYLAEVRHFVCESFLCVNTASLSDTLDINSSFVNNQA